jgi:hypothetical protein
MSSVRVEGLNKIQEALKDLKPGVGPRVLEEWTNSIGDTAKELCNDADGKRIKIGLTKDFEFHCEVADKEAIDCIIQAIKTYKNSMPLPVQRVFRRFSEQLENKKEEEEDLKNTSA